MCSCYSDFPYVPLCFCHRTALFYFLYSSIYWYYYLRCEDKNKLQNPFLPKFYKIINHLTILLIKYPNSIKTLRSISLMSRSCIWTNVIRSEIKCLKPNLAPYLTQYLMSFLFFVPYSKCISSITS